MDTVEEWRVEALRLGRAKFVAKHRCLFLLERIPISSSSGTFDFDTISIRIDAEGSAEMPQQQRRVAALMKREGNPFPDRISIGRAGNCDVVIREPFVSKLHAHFHVADDGKLRLTDNRSSNGTWHNGKKLGADEKVALNLGDEVGVGPLRLRLLDAGGLFDALGR
jgi:hypothetical protein